jgi:hypothetical protein
MPQVNSGVIVGRTPEVCDCPECRRDRERMGIYPPDGEAIERAETLLRRFLTPEQAAEWEKYQRLTIKGSDGALFRIWPKHVGYHQSVVRKGYREALGIAVWPIGLTIAADWALAMKLYIEHDAHNVVNSGCHGAADFDLDRWS